jgi:Trp operon repressor
MLMDTGVDDIMDLMTMFQNKRAEQQKNDILSMLSDDERMDFEERAGIMEYDGGLTRVEAERRALERILERKEFFIT